MPGVQGLEFGSLAFEFSASFRPIRFVGIGQVSIVVPVVVANP